MHTVEEVTFGSQPTLLAAWPGMGNVGITAMAYLRRKLDAKPFVEIDMNPYHKPDSVVVRNGIVQLPAPPKAVFYYHVDPDLLLFECNAQVAGLGADAILDRVQQYKVKSVYTTAAFAQEMSYRASSQVLVACTNEALISSVASAGVTPMPDGYIAGLNGLLISAAKTRDIEAACFLGTMPSYATNQPYPKASLAIVQVLSALLSIRIDTTELEATVKEVEPQLAIIEEQHYRRNRDGDR